MAVSRSSLLIPVREAVPAEASKLHEIDILDVIALAQMFNQSTKGCGLQLGAHPFFHRPLSPFLSVPKKEAPAERRLRCRGFPLREMDQGIHPESDKAAQRNWFRPKQPGTSKGLTRSRQEAPGLTSSRRCHSASWLVWSLAVDGELLRAFSGPAPPSELPHESAGPQDRDALLTTRH